jgi:malonate transporter and related proteins
MIAFLLLSLPIFAVVVLGWITVRVRLGPAGLLDSIGWFSFRVALPALVFRLIASQPIGRSFNVTFFAGYLLAGSVIFASVLVMSRVAGAHLGAAGAHATTATVSNLGFLGPPLMLAFFGEPGAGPLAMAIVAEITVLLSVGSIIMGASRGNRQRAGSVVLRGALSNPLLAAIVLGAGFAAASVVIPQPFDRFLAFLGAAAAPTALFALGGTLALKRIDRATAFAATGITAAKVLAYPALVWCVLGCLLRLAPFWVQSGVLIASLPSAASNFVVAERYQADAERVSAAIVLSTIASVGVVPFVAWLGRRIDIESLRAALGCLAGHG